jgi:predicted nucleic acid-binding protein
MIVVADTSPINYLVLTQLQDLLPRLFDRLLIPEAVRRELQAGGTPEPVRQFIDTPPAWLEVRSAGTIPATLAHLDSGEREALALALSVAADFVLIDERIGRQAAEGHGLEVYGTLGVILVAAERELIALEDALARLQETNFRVSPRLLKIVRERMKRS